VIPLSHLFEGHLTVANLERSMHFYGQKLGLEMAHVVPERNVAFYWIGGRGKSMLGLWETGSGPQRMSLHLAFAVELADLLRAPEILRKAGIEPRDFGGRPSDEPVVLAWMPAAAVYFQDPDGHQLEYLCMLAGPPRPDLGVVPWSEWQSIAPKKS
jgi:catechol 2,3-dioxygenase-like lactoylglutathione lyase family enzyme